MNKTCTRCGWLAEGAEAVERGFGWKNSSTLVPNSHCKPCRRRQKENRPVAIADMFVLPKLIGVSYAETLALYRKEYPKDRQKRGYARMATRLHKNKGYELTEDAKYKIAQVGLKHV